ncbi:MAG: hypothetical protein U0N03_01900, partial [Lachnospiraceae bacterium]
FRANLQNATHFVGVAYPPNKISKTGLKMQAFSACFMKFCLALNSYKKRIIPSKTEKESAQLFQKRIDKTKKRKAV